MQAGAQGCSHYQHLDNLIFLMSSNILHSFHLCAHWHFLVAMLAPKLVFTCISKVQTSIRLCNSLAQNEMLHTTAWWRSTPYRGSFLALSKYCNSASSGVIPLKSRNYYDYSVLSNMMNSSFSLIGSFLWSSRLQRKIWRHDRSSQLHTQLKQLWN